MRSLVFEFSAAGTQSWTADADYLLQGGQSGGPGNFLITTDNSVATTDFSAASATKLLQNEVYLYLNGTTNKLAFPAQLPVPSGTTLFVKSSAFPNTCLLYLDPAVQLE